MADKRISQLIERTDIANNDVLPIVASGATTTNKVTISTLQDWMQDNLDVGVTSVGLSVPSAFSVSGSPVTTSGNITISGAGTTAQYIRGDGSLADFPSISGGGSSVSYYLNGSVSQGTIGGVAYLEMNKVPVFGAGTDFTRSSNGYIASFITDAGDPSLLEIPAGNWNFETYLQASSGGGSPTFYIELYKVNSGGTATLIASNSGTPESISLGTNINPYFSALAVPTTSLTLTDRLAIRIYVTPVGRTITLHTENGHLCQIITTFTTGLTALNGLTAQVQNFATGTSGTDFNISSASTTHTFNLPDASASNRGVVTTGTQTFAGYKIFNGTIGVNNDLQLATVGTALNTFIKNINATGQTSIGSNGFGFNNANNIYFSGSSKGGGIIAFSNTGNQTYTLQDASGTLAFTSDLGAYLPLAGGTLTGALGGTSLNFSGDIQTATRLISATGGQQILINANNGGSTNRIESVGTLPLALVSAAAITMASGGTTPQITLATTGAVTLTGGITAGESITIGTGGNYVAGSIYSDATWGMLFRAKQASPTTAQYRWAKSDDTELMRIANGANGLEIGYVNSVGLHKLDVNGSVKFEGTLFGRNNAVFQNSTTNIVNIGSDQAMYGGSNSDGGLFVYGNNKLHLSTNSQRRLTIDGSGNVGIGTASPTTYSLAGRHFEVNDAGGGFAFLHNNTTSVKSFFAANESGGVAALFTFSNHPLTFGTNNTERMRITSGGDVLVGKSSFTSNSLRIDGNGILSNSRGGTGTNSHCNFFNDNGLVGSITTSGSSTSYNTSSDYRLKENVKPVENALSVLTKLKPCTFNFIADADEEVMGFIAHEVQEVIPQAVTGEKDGFRIEEVEVSPAQLDEEGSVITEAIVEEKEIPVYQGIDHSKLVPLLVAAIQELKTEIDSLKNQIK